MPKIITKNPAFKNYVIIESGEYAEKLGEGETLPVPACCSDPVEAAEWAVAAKKVTQKSRYGFCEDCTPYFQLRMIQQGRCENPGVQFVQSVEQGIRGVLR